VTIGAPAALAAAVCAAGLLGAPGRPAEAGAAAGAIGVTIRHETDLAPLPGLVVRLGPGNVVARTNAQGHVWIGDIAPGLYTLAARLDGFLIHSISLAVEAGRTSEVVLLARPVSSATPGADWAGRELDLVLSEAGRLHESVDVSGRSEPTPPSAIELPAQEVRAVAGGAENVFRVLRTLPGVAGVNEFQGRIAVRGGSPDQNLTVLDGVEVHTPFRLEGLVSAFNPETVSDFQLEPVPLEPRYGDRLSSLLIVATRDGTRESGLAGSLAASISDANLVLEGRVPGSASGSWLLAARRTYYDLALERFTDHNLPGFRDLQLKTTWQPFAGARLSAFGLLSRESGRIEPEPEPSSPEPSEPERAVFGAQHDLVGVGLDWSVGPRWSLATTLSGYWTRASLDLDVEDASYDDLTDFERRTSVRDLSFRQEARLRASPSRLFQAGVEIHSLDTAWGMTGGLDVPFLRRFGASSWGTANAGRVEARLAPARGAAWLQAQAGSLGGFALDLATRIEWNTLNREVPVLPRLRVTRSLGAAAQVWSGIGWYSQSPGYEKLLLSDYYLDLAGSRPAPANERAVQAVVGFKRDLGRGISLRAETYYKRMDRLLVGRLETDSERERRLASYEIPPDYPGGPLTERRPTSQATSDAEGRAYGLDLLLQRRALSAETRLTGWIAYSFGRSERTAYGKTFPADQDRRHALSFAGNLRVTPRFQISATWLLSSGLPFSPVQPDVAFQPDFEDLDFDGDREEKRALRWGDGGFVMDIEDHFLSLSQLNSKRLPAYARLDLRFGYAPTWGGRRWELYLDVMNALNRANTTYLDYEHAPGARRGSADFRLQEKRIEGLPVVPSFGVRVTF
jgi:hypothetical protein